MACKTVFRNVTTKSGQLRIKTIWSGLELNISILENGNAWSAKVNEEFIRDYASDLTIDPEDYIEKVKKYICCTPEGIDMKVIENKFLIFVPLEKMTIRYFSTPVEKSDFPTMLSEWLDETIYENKELLNTIEKHETQIKRMQDDMQSCRAIFQSAVDERREMKRKMLSTFTVLINEKKRRIQFLTEVIEANKYDMNINTTNKGSNNQKQDQKKEVLSDSDASDSEYSTDKEKTVSDEEDSYSEELLKTSKPLPVLAPRENRAEIYESPISSKKAKLNSYAEDGLGECSNATKSNTLPPTLTISVEEDKKDSDEPENFSTQELYDRL